MTNIMMIGAGYIGLVTGTLFADRGNNVICIDKNKKIIEMLKQGKVHIFEPGLEQLVKKNIKKDNLKFSSNINYNLDKIDVIFLGINTPSNSDGSFNLTYLLNAAKEIGIALKNSTGYKVVVGKSTVPQGTYKKVIKIIKHEIGENPNLEWDYVSNPETLAEGTAIRDFAKPNRIIIGANSKRAFEVMEEIYHPFNIKNSRILKGSHSDAELAKLFSNTALAARVAMVNEFARIADITPEADMDTIRKMICEDERIGHNFMFPSPGYGGSCFPKDIQGVVSQAKEDGYEPLLLNQIHNSNESHKNYNFQRIKDILKNKKNLKIGVWGVTFKPNTDDMRDAASIKILTELINFGAEIIVYDPKDRKAKEIFGNKIKFVDSQYKATKDVDALILITEWAEFDVPNFEKLKNLMKGDQLFDLRNRWLPKIANSYGFNYYGLGRKFEIDIKNKKTILITGCAGFIGSHVTENLLKRGDIIIGIDEVNDYYDLRQKEENLKLLKKYENFKFYKEDLSNYERIREIFEKEKPNYIAHIAARAGVRFSIEDPFIYEKSNVKVTLNLLELAKKFKIKNFVLTSSSSIYGNRSKVPFVETDIVDNPISPYAATKKSTELLAHSYHHLHKLNITIIRPFTIYGPRGRPDMAPFLFTKLISRGIEIKKFGDGNSKRDYTYIGDFVKGFICAIDKPLGYEIFNLGNSSPISLNEFISTIENVVGKKAKINQMQMQPGDVSLTYADISKAKKLLGYEPKTKLKDGMKEFWKWYKMFNRIE